MNPTQLRYKQALDGDGNLEFLEIWQGNQCIRISLQGTTYGDGSSNFKWGTIKKTIDTLQTQAIKAAAEGLSRG